MATSRRSQYQYAQPQSNYYAAAPIPTPAKQPLAYSYAPISRVSASPPEHISSTNSSTSGSRTSGGTYSAPSATYSSGRAPGAYSCEYDGSSSGGNGVDLVDMLSERMNNAFDPIGMDQGVVRQAKTSGQLNAKHRELLELQALAQRRLKSSRVNFQEGMKAAKEVKRDLEWTQRKVGQLKAKAERRDSEGMRRAERKYARRGDEDDY